MCNSRAHRAVYRTSRRAFSVSLFDVVLEDARRSEHVGVGDPVWRAAERNLWDACDIPDCALHPALQDFLQERGLV